MKFEDGGAWENVTKAIYNPEGSNGQLFWQKINYYQHGDECKVVQNGYQYKLSKRFPLQYVLSEEFKKDQAKARVLKRRETFRRAKSKFVQRQSSRQLLMLASKQIKSNLDNSLKPQQFMNPQQTFALKNHVKSPAKTPELGSKRKKILIEIEEENEVHTPQVHTPLVNTPQLKKKQSDKDGDMSKASTRALS